MGCGLRKIITHWHLFRFPLQLRAAHHFTNRKPSLGLLRLILRSKSTGWLDCCFPISRGSLVPSANGSTAMPCLFKCLKFGRVRQLRDPRRISATLKNHVSPFDDQACNSRPTVFVFYVEFNRGTARLALARVRRKYRTMTIRDRLLPIQLPLKYSAALRILRHTSL